MRPLTMRGAVAVEDLTRALSEYTPANIVGRSSWLIDFRSAELDISNTDAMQLSDCIEQYRRTSPHANKPCHVAILVNDDFNYGISRIIQGYMENGNIKVQVSRSERDAQHWLKQEAWNSHRLESNNHP